MSVEYRNIEASVFSVNGTIRGYKGPCGVGEERRERRGRRRRRSVINWLR